MTCRSRSWSLAAVALALFTTVTLHAAVVQFTLDPDQSSIALAGSVVGNPITQQGAGSLVTSFSGTIAAELSGTTIRFPGGSVLDAQTNGVWQPGPGGASGSAPADYGAQASTVLGTVRGALRNLLLDLKSEPLEIKEGQFDASNLLFSFLTNSGASFDYDAGFLGSSGLALSGISTNRIVNGATLTTTAEGQTLTINVDTEFKFSAIIEDDSAVHLTGRLVATRLNLPTISSVEIKDQMVILHVTAAGATPRLDSSTDLKTWTTRAPERTTAGGDVVLTLPVTGPMEYYRVAK